MSDGKERADKSMARYQAHYTPASTPVPTPLPTPRSGHQPLPIEDEEDSDEEEEEEANQSDPGTEKQGSEFEEDSTNEEEIIVTNELPLEEKLENILDNTTYLKYFFSFILVSLILSLFGRMIKTMKGLF